MEPEDVEVKQELPSDDEHDSTMPSTVNLNFNTLDFIIKEESDKLDKSGTTSAEANSRGNCAKTIPAMQEEKGGKPGSSNDTESEDSGSGWSVKNNGQTGSKSESDSDSSDSSGVMDRGEPVRRKVVESKKTNNKRKINSDGPPIRQNSIKRFDCHYCPEKFCNHYNRERHEKRHEARLPSEQRIKRKQHYCYICNKDHDTKDELHKHLCVHADMIPYLCAECDNPTRLISVRLLNKHIQLHQQIETGIIKCRFCPARFHSLSGCQQHEKGHVDKDKQEEAEAKIENESKRLNVKILIVDGLKRYECEYCKRSYTQLVALRRHAKSHTNKEGFVCKTCGKVFNNYPSLAAHEKIHTDSVPYKCETCGRGFKELLTLIGHRHIHTGDKPHACHCGLSFIKKGGLMKHKSKCDIPENLGSCACRFCQVSFPSYLEMIRHVQEIHAPDMEDTMCRFCPIMFKDAAQLAGHELRHELPGVLKCTQCTRIFKNKFYLDLHIKVIPDKKNGIEQIYIVKSDSQNTTDALAGASMEPEDVEVKQELPSDDEHDSTMPSTANLNLNTLDFIIKEESDKLDKSGSTSPEANSRGNCAKTIPAMQEEKGGKPDSSSDTESEDSGSDWSGKNYGQTGTKSESDSDSSDSSGVMDREEPVRRKVVESKKTNNKRKINSDGPPIRQNSIKRFDCHYCSEKFCNHYNRERHEKRHEARLPSEQRIKRKQHYCYICNKDHDTKDELHKHLCVHADMIPYLCAECENPTRLISVRLLNKHIQLHQQIETGIIKCRFCPARFHSLSGCQQHEKGHVDKDQQEEAEAKIENESKRLNVKILIVDGLKRYECEYCKNSYTQLVALRRHVKSHTNEEGFVCKTCGKVFNNYPSLAAHEKIHTDSVTYKCETCGRGFKELLTLVGHRHIHTGDKPHACHCGLSFIKKGGLTKHKSKCDIPENLGSCTCRFCQVSFPSYLEMIRHVREIHAPDMEDTMCRFCPIMFKDAAQLAGHELRHELPGVLKCTQCTRIFKNKFYLDLHIKTHESSFTCHVCGKTFLHNVNLRVHRRVHSDKRPHVCDLCSTTFNCLGSLRKHRLTHYKLTSRNYIPGLVDKTVVAIDDDDEKDEEDAEEGVVEPGSSNANQNEDEQPETASNGITVE